MKKFLALISARNREFYRDRSALIWTLLFPFIVLAGFTYGYSGKSEPILRMMVTPLTAENHPVVRALHGMPGMDFRAIEEESVAVRKLSRFDTDILISVSDDGRKLTYSVNPDSEKGKLATQLLLSSVAASADPKPTLEARAIEGKPIRYSDWLLPGLLAMNIMFGSMFGVGYVIVRYRKNGVLKRLRATPLSAFHFLSAQVASRMLLMIITSIMVVGGGMLLIGFKVPGGLDTWLTLSLFLGVSSAAMISVGLMVAARIATEEVADGILNLMTWPMIFLSGIWFSIDGASPWVQQIAKIMPLTHVVTGLRAILIDGAQLAQVYPQILILIVISFVFTAIASLIFRWT